MAIVVLAAAVVLVLVPDLQLVGKQALGSQLAGSHTFVQSAGLQLAALAAGWLTVTALGCAVVLAARAGAGVCTTATEVVFA